MVLPSDTLGRGPAANLLSAWVAGGRGDGAELLTAGTAATASLWVALGVLLCGLLAVLFGIRAYRPLRAAVPVLAASRGRPSSASTGRAWVSGTAERANHTLEAPLTGSRCLAYAVDGESLEYSRRSSRWKDFTGKTEVAPFYVSDGGDYVLVTPTRMGARTGRTVDDQGEIGTAGAEMAFDWDDADYDPSRDVLDLDRNEEFHVDADEDLPSAVRTALSEHGELSRPGDVGETATRFREWTLEPGDEVHVLGRIQDPLASRPTLTDDGVFVVSHTPPRETALKQLTVASRNLAGMLALLFPVVAVGVGHFLQSRATATLGGGLLLGALVLGGLSTLGRFAGFSAGIRRRRRLKRVGVAAAVGLGVALLGVGGATLYLAQVVLPALGGSGLLDSPTVQSVLVVVLGGAVLAIGVVVGGLTYGALSVLDWPSGT